LEGKTFRELKLLLRERGLGCSRANIKNRAATIAALRNAKGTRAESESDGMGSERDVGADCPGAVRPQDPHEAPGTLEMAPEQEPQGVQASQLPQEPQKPLGPEHSSLHDGPTTPLAVPNVTSAKIDTDSEGKVSGSDDESSSDAEAADKKKGRRKGAALGPGTLDANVQGAVRNPMEPRKSGASSRIGGAGVRRAAEAA